LQGAADRSIIAIAGCNTCRSVIPSAWPRRASGPRWVAWATRTIIPWPRPSMGCQGRGDPSSILEEPRGGGMGDLSLGRWVQPSQVTGTDRLPSARRGRSSLLPSSHRARNGSVTHTNEPPQNPGRFSWRCFRPRRPWLLPSRRSNSPPADARPDSRACRSPTTGFRAPSAPAGECTARPVPRGGRS